MDVFIFLFGSVHFLLFLLLTALQVATHVDVGTLRQQLAEVVLTEVNSLADEAGFVLALFEQLLEGVGGDLRAGAVDLVEPDAHVWLIILKNI